MEKLEEQLKNGGRKPEIFLNAMVFFLDDKQLGIVEEALSAASKVGGGKTRASRKAAGLRLICGYYVEQEQKANKKKGE
ncbi:MAG: hypothetical protein ACYSWP_07750 [Planctomycetota bacterium]